MMIGLVFGNFFSIPIRLTGLLLVVFFVHQLITKQSLETYDLNYLVKRVIIYLALTIMAMLAMIQFNAYGIFTLIIVALHVVLNKYFKFKSILNPFKVGQDARKRSLVNFFGILEQQGDFLKKSFKEITIYVVPKKISLDLIAVFSIMVLTFVARFYFIDYDTYSLSPAWLKSLSVVKDFNHNQWLEEDFTVVGELATVNLLSTLLGLSKELTLFVFGLLESCFLVFVIYYFIKTHTQSKYTYPLIGSLSFALLFTFLPMNLNTLLQHSQIYLGLAFCLVFKVLAIDEREMTFSKGRDFIILLVLVSVINLTSLYLTLVVLPTYLAVYALVLWKREGKKVLMVLKVYVMGTLFFIAGNLIIAQLKGHDALAFFRNNLLSVANYSFFPELLFPLDTLLLIYQAIGWGTLLVLSQIRSPSKYRVLIFTLFFLLFLYLNHSGYHWFDKDLFFQVLTVAVPIQLGFFIWAITNVVASLFKKHKWKVIRAIQGFSVLFIAFLCVISVVNIRYKEKLLDKDLKIDILNVYDQLSRDHLKNSFMVVNSDYGEKMAGNEHFFMNYEFFNKDYLRQDSIYNAIKYDLQKLEANPDKILPESLFVFLTHKPMVKGNNEFLRNNTIERERSKKTINDLKNRGRRINTYYQSENLEVVEIVNSKNLSNLKKMIMDDNR